MRILVKKAFRDLWSAKLRTISIIVTILLSVGLGIGLMNATHDAISSFDRRSESTNYEDMGLQFDPAALNLTQLGTVSGVKDVMGRMFILTQAQFGDTEYKSHWVCSPYYDHKPYSLINGYQMAEGRYMSSPTAQECLVGNLFAKANGVEVGDSVSVFYNGTPFSLSVVGIVASPEYVYVVDDAGWPQPSLLMPVFTTYELASALLNLTPNTYNELLVRTEAGASNDKVLEQMELALTMHGVRITRSMLGSEEADYEFSRTDASSMGKMGILFGIIILIVAAVIIYNSMARLIAAQRAYIGVMGALGGSKWKVLMHYGLFGLLMGTAGSLLGIPTGFGISALTIYAYARFIGIVDPVYSLQLTYVLLFCALGIGISTLAALFGALRAISIGPREALTTQYQTQDFSKKPLVELAFDKVAYKRPILPRIAIRNLARHRFRTLITILSLALSLVLLFSCIAFSIAFTQPLERNYSEYEKWDLKATLLERSDASWVHERLNATGLTGLRTEVMLDDYVPIMDGDKMKFVHVQAFEPGSQLRSFNVISGKKDLAGGVLMGSIIAKELGLEAGSQVTFVIGNTTTTAKVMGITGEFLDDSILMTLPQADDLLLTQGKVNAVITEQGGMSRDALESALRAQLPIASAAYTQDVIDGMTSMLEGITAMFYIFIGFGVVSEVLFVSTTVVLSILEREGEFVSLRAIGTKPGKIRRMIVLESMILLGGGLVIGLPLGAFVTIRGLAYIVGDLMYYNITIPPAVYVLTTAIAVVSAMLAAFISSNHIRKIKMADAIRQRQAA